MWDNFFNIKTKMPGDDNKTILKNGDLGFLGKEFQYKLVKEFMEDKDLFPKLCSVVDQNMFTENGLRQIVGVLKDYFNKNEAVPSYGLMDISIRAKYPDTTNRDILLATLQKVRDTSSEGSGNIQEMGVNFFKQQNLIMAINKSAKYLLDGDFNHYSDIEEIISKAINVGLNDDMYVHYDDNLEDVLSDDYRQPIPTGIEKLDNILEGGIGKGELGLIVGPTSFGKTSMTTAICAYASTHLCELNNYKGFNVVQFVFEDKLKQIQRKHIAYRTNVEAKDLSKEEYVGKVKDFMSKDGYRIYAHENLRIVKLKNGVTGVPEIKSILRKFINEGFRVDLASIDYFECMKLLRPETAQDKDYTREGKTMRALESIADELNLALWVSTQGTKDSGEKERLNGSDMAGSKSKLDIAHIALFISRTDAMRQDNRATIYLKKSRSGAAGITLENVYFNNGTCHISTDDSYVMDAITIDNNAAKYVAKKSHDVAAECLSEYKESLKKKDVGKNL